MCRDDESNTDLEIGSAPGGNDEPSYMYYVNDGVYGSFNCLLYDHAEVEASIPCKSKESNKHEKNKWKFVIAINNFIFKILCTECIFLELYNSEDRSVTEDVCNFDSWVYKPMDCLNFLYIAVKITARESYYFLYFPFLAVCKLYFPIVFFLFHPHFSRLSWFGGLILNWVLGVGF